MDKKKFFGARMENKIISIIDKVAEEKNMDRTSAIKILVQAGWEKISLQKALDMYKEGKISIDKAAKIANITISEMMEEITAHKIKSDETIEEYKNSVKVLLKD